MSNLKIDKHLFSLTVPDKVILFRDKKTNKPVIKGFVTSAIAGTHCDSVEYSRRFLKAVTKCARFILKHA